MDGAALLGRGSLWSATATPGPELPALEDAVTADVAIVGGGFTGLSTALHLAERGVRAVVVEAREIGEGASGLNGGQVIPGLKRSREELAQRFGAERAERMVALGDGAAARVYDLIARHGIDCGLERNGWFRGAHSPMAMAYLEKTHKEMAARGIDAVLVDRAGTERMLGTDQYVGGLHDRRAGAIQPLSYVRGLARAAVAQGATIFARSPVTGLKPQDGKWRVTAGRGSVTAGQVLLATGAYTDRLWPGLAQTFIGVQSAQMATDPLSSNLRASILPCRAVVSDTRKLSNYFRVDATGRLVMGGRGPLGDTPSPSTLAAIARAAERRFPMLGKITWKHAWCGRIDMTLDEMPRIHRPAPGLWTVVGYNGRGIALASTMGAVMADKLAGGSDPALDFPDTPLATVPFHAFRGPGVAGAIAWYKFRDALGFAA
ncbi:glycine/D-amino acid oxidase-like deaminating enzyme [Stella humosa]|uniref:Glycine/D-amino acid oxidase-like deaminating enzyme n=1 Tax=Stella humosa TaxID=94 RepID=A0A3N1L2Z7_9PROT|nr:FAD-binding oxidoreductase [Stella humosa]ROP83785.1 glycine/D-amino acid oxidase-like deaminating enzyme [Stella humosa]BBK32954.1 FAD-dependent oxidoreductase [Stella humosa]